ncbi:biotin operon repressor [Neobacillus niacini]|nr:biotin operon repressor [Neobacillus niacini]
MHIRKYMIAFLVVVFISDITSNTLIHAKSYSSPNHLNSTNLLSQWKLVEKEIGKQGVMKPDDIFYISLPRNDLKVTVKGIPIRTGLALGGWVAFKQMGNQTMVMGDLVLTEKEIQPVMSQLLQQGIQVSALHNHLLNETPRIMYLHIMGHGNPVQLAKAIHSGLELTKIPKNEIGDSYAFPFDKQKLDSIFRHKGTITNGIYHISISRLEKIMEDGIEIPPAMGVATSINFQPTENGKAAITGDFVLTAEEVNPVARTLRKHGIEVTAVHNHMLTENPRLFFMHFWANDVPFKLANALREALDKTHSM